MRYRGRIAPTPSGNLHLGHVATFWLASERARKHDGTLVYRVENLDKARCHEKFEKQIRQDLHWLGIDCQEGPWQGGAFGPYRQSERFEKYVAAMRLLAAKGLVYPCGFSRKEIAAENPKKSSDGEIIFPVTMRSAAQTEFDESINWRFRVPSKMVTFTDAIMGKIENLGEADFGDFLVWRKDGSPSYELAVVLDDVSMEITEVVRGRDLLTSTARQLLLYSAMDAEPPQFAHAPLVMGEDGSRLAKTKGSDGLSALRESGMPPSEVVALALGRTLCGGRQEERNPDTEE